MKCNAMRCHGLVDNVIDSRVHLMGSVPFAVSDDVIFVPPQSERQMRKGTILRPRHTDCRKLSKFCWLRFRIFKFDWLLFYTKVRIFYLSRIAIIQ